MVVLAISIHSSISKTYFSRRPQINDGCYFIVLADWLRRWRCWLLRNTNTDVNGVQCEAEYHSLQEIQFPRLCSHGRMVIPGYMDHFIRGFSSLPCSVWLKSCFPIRIWIKYLRTRLKSLQITSLLSWSNIIPFHFLYQGFSMAIQILCKVCAISLVNVVFVKKKKYGIEWHDKD